MNHKIALATLALFTAFAGTAATLHAGTDVRINIGLGGPLRLPPPPPPVVIVDRTPDRPRGYWKVITVREWVPGRSYLEHRHGRPVRRFEPGHYAYRNERVWVSHERDRDLDHRDRDYGRDHGRDYGRDWNNDSRR